MRILLAGLAVLSVVSTATLNGCYDRQNMRAVPNRENRAGGDGSQHLGDMVNQPVANPNESYYTMKSGDTLYSIAKQFNTNAKWLIRRNELEESTAIKPGKTLIVPAGNK
jgi:LysM repeat protein